MRLALPRRATRAATLLKAKIAIDSPIPIGAATEPNELRPLQIRRLHKAVKLDVGVHGVDLMSVEQHPDFVGPVLNRGEVGPWTAAEIGGFECAPMKICAANSPELDQFGFCQKTGRQHAPSVNAGRILAQLHVWLGVEVWVKLFKRVDDLIGLREFRNVTRSSAANLTVCGKAGERD